MDLEEDIKLYLPQYLSEDNLVALKQQLKAFGEGHDSGEYFTRQLIDQPNLFQGDGVKSIMFDLPNPELKEDIPVLLLSNSCDMDINNKRFNPCKIMYAPILNLDKYVAVLEKQGVSSVRIKDHVNNIKNQTISQILYLPTTIIYGHDSIVMFDKAISIPLSSENISKMLSSRMFTLSNYGFYLLLLKLSYHFTRIQEKVDRSV